MKRIVILLFLLIIYFNACTNKTDQQKLNSENIESNHEEVKELMLEYLVEDSESMNDILNSSFSEILLNLSWALGNNSGYIRDELDFYQNNTYSIADFYGLGDYALGLYEIINDDEVLLHYPAEFPRDFTSIVSSKLENIFTDNILLLKIDREHRDFYNLGKLYSENVFFVSNLISPSEEEYEIDNAIAIKTKGYIKILNTLNIRTEPSIESQLAKVYLNNRQRVDPNYLIKPHAVLSLVFPEEIYEFEAITKNYDEIDGIRKPWYRIKIPHEFNVTYAWVFGGYVEEVENTYIEQRVQNELLINIAKELVDRGLAYENYVEVLTNKYFPQYD